MRAMLFVLVMASVAYAQPQIASDQQRCPIQLVGHEPSEIAALMKKHRLKPVTLEMVELPRSPGIFSPGVMSVWIDGQEYRGLLRDIAGDGCIRQDVRHAVDANGDLYEFDGRGGVVDYAKQQCLTARGWIPCNLKGQRWRMYIVADPRVRLAAIFSSDLRFTPMKQ